MFELKKGMSFVRKDKIGGLLEFDYSEKNRFWDSDVEGGWSDIEEIDWEKTAKLNGIDLEMFGMEKLNELEEKATKAIDKMQGKILSKRIQNNLKIEGLKLDQGKSRYDLLPFGAVDQLVRVLTYGAEKYAPNNWRLVENPIERYKAATLRHLSLYMQGEEVDKESGISHLAHAATNVIFLMEFEKEKFDMKLNEQELINFLKEGSKK